MKKVGRKILKVIVILIDVLLVLWLLVFISSKIRLKSDQAFLEEKGYCNLVSAGDYAVNVLSFGNENGKHRIIAMAGYGVPDSSITMRRMTAALETDNQVIFLDRAGYGISDDTTQEMTVENIVEAYRTALKNAGIEAPYVLMPHSIGGVYATYWESKYPDEVEAVVIIDGTELEAAPSEEKGSVNEAALYYKLDKAGLGGTGNLLLKHFIPPKEWLSNDEQRAEYAMALMTFDSRALLSENEQEIRNIKTAWASIVTNDIPKIYISTAYFTADDIEADGIPTDEMIDMLRSAQYYKQKILLPYFEKLGNCELINLPGDHLIYEQKPDECGKIISDFIEGLEN